jgi:metal-sulfur cluster biosynthetic enzyme
MRDTVQGDIQHTLSRIYDPCSIAAKVPLSILEMGMVVYEVNEAGEVLITLRPTSPMCELAGSIGQAVIDGVSRIRGVTAVELLLDSTALWMPERMTPAGRAKLAARRDESIRQVGIRPQQWREKGAASAGAPLPMA